MNKENLHVTEVEIMSVIGQFPCILPECPTTGVLERSLCPISAAEQLAFLEPSYKLYSAQIEWWLSLHSSTRC